MTPSTQEIDDAIATLSTSMRYDPPDRWLKAHQLLSRLREEFRRMRAPYEWPAFIAYFLCLPIGIYVYVTSDAIWWRQFAGLALMTVVPSSMRAAMSWLAERQHPLLRREREVVEASSYFDEPAEILSGKGVAP